MHLRKQLTFVLSAALFLALLTGALLWHPQPSAAAGETALVNSAALNIRSGPGTNYGIVAKAGLNERLPVLDKSGDWYKVKLSSGATGWVAGWLVKIEYPSSAAAQTAQTAVIKGSSMNVRSGPGTGYGLVTQVGQGERFPVIEKSGDWYKVRLKNGNFGWLAGWLISIETSSAPASPASPPAQPVTGNQVAVIKSSSMNVRSGPGTGYGIVTQVGQAERFAVLQKSGDWYKVQLKNGSTGWLAGWLVAIETTSLPPLPINPPAQTNPGSAGNQLAVVNSSTLNVRSGPGTGYGVVGQVAQGNEFPVLEQSGDWYRVQTAGGSGWLAGWLVSLKTVPTPQTPPKSNDDISRGDDRTPVVLPGRTVSLKLSTSGGETSAVIEGDAPFEFSSFCLSGPDRLVLDLKGVVCEGLPLVTDVNSKTVSQVRTGQFQKNPDVARVVFDLSGGAQYVAALSGDKKKLTVQTYIPNIEGSYKGKIICVDAGHGGPEPGAIGPGGTKEKDITLEVARRVAKLLEARGAKVIMTRTADVDLGLYERPDIANAARADIFVSIHMNAHTSSSYGGTSTFVYSGNGDPDQSNRLQESKRLARSVQAEMVKALGLRDIGVLDANFAVLRTAAMPAILAEVAFISNPAEEKLMRTDDFKNKSAEAIVKGIGLYFSEVRTALAR